MKKSLLVVLIAAVLSSCVTTKHVIDNNYQLNHTYSTHNPAGVVINNQCFEDEYVSIQLLQVLNEGIFLTLVNNHNTTIRILWDEAAFVDHNGFSHRINHDNSSVSKILTNMRSRSSSSFSFSEGVSTIVDENKIQIPSVIPAGTRVNTIIVPTDNASIAMYEPVDFTNKEEAELTLQEMRTLSELPTIKLLLPIEVDGKKIEYTATFTNEFQMYNAKGYADMELLILVPVAALLLVVL